MIRSIRSLGLGLVIAMVARPALAQTPVAPTGAPPPEAKPVVEAAKGPADVPATEVRLDGTTASLSAGGMLTTGNSRSFALSGNGNVETRVSNNGLGASLLANYGQGGPPGEAIQVTTQNVQGRVRYDRYLVDELALFVVNTGRHDRFQGLDFRYNLDPGVKYLFLKEATNALWIEAGYDLQHDIRRDADRVVRDENGDLVFDANGRVVALDKSQTDHSSRVFVGFKHGFSEEVTLATGVEYLQSFVDDDRARLNVDALVAAKIGGGLAFGFGFSARFDNLPIAGKEQLDTSSTVSLIYAFSDVSAAPKPPMCPCPAAAPARKRSLP